MDGTKRVKFISTNVPLVPASAKVKNTLLGGT